MEIRLGSDAIQLKVKTNDRKGKKSRNPLDHPKKALVFTQIYMAAEPVTAKEISRNTGLPLNTVYNYIRELSKDGVISSKTESMGNLIQERWFIDVNYDNRRISQIQTTTNEVYKDVYFTDPADLGRQLTMLISFARPYIRKYEENKQKFIERQQNSSKPAIIKIWSLFPEEFDYAAREIARVRRAIRQLDERLRDQQEIPSIHLPRKGETNLVFMVALPDMREKEGDS